MKIKVEWRTNSDRNYDSKVPKKHPDVAFTNFTNNKHYMNSLVKWKTSESRWREGGEIRRGGCSAACTLRQCRGDVISWNGIIQFLLLKQLEPYSLCGVKRAQYTATPGRSETCTACMCKTQTLVKISSLHTFLNFLSSDYLVVLYVKYTTKTSEFLYVHIESSLLVYTSFV